VSIYFPVNINAQNSALSQSGGGSDAKQETEIEQSSEQNSQIVSGESSTTSGNNLLCQGEQNNDDVSRASLSCQNDIQDDQIPPNEGSAILELVVRQGPTCLPPEGCPYPMGTITVIDHTDSDTILTVWEPRASIPYSQDFLRIPIPEGHAIKLVAGPSEDPDFVFESADFIGRCNGVNTCEFVMGSTSINVEIQFHYHRR
jgi:hypothetical protein